ncbi:MAG: hypothetical protein GY835_05680 [bacterium]|nr:hypothetical protein [bacterium]
MPQSSIPNTEPTAISAGDSANWIIYHSDYLPDNGARMSYALTRPDEQHTVESMNNGDGGHLLTLTSAETATWGSGEYTLYGYIFDGSGERKLLRECKLTVLPNALEAVTGHDGRSKWEIIHDNLLTAYEQYTASNGVVSKFQIDDITREFKSAEEIITAIEHASRMKNRERDQKLLCQGRPTGRKLMFRMRG